MRAGGPQWEGLAGTPGTPEAPPCDQHGGPAGAPELGAPAASSFPPVDSGPLYTCPDLWGLTAARVGTITLMLKPVLLWLLVTPGLLSQNMAG